MIDLQRLEAFIKVYEERNITKAAQQLFVTQQGLSRTIKALESELELPLFVRKNNGLTPTAYGDSLYQYAKHISADFANAKIELEKLKHQTSNILRIGVSNGVFPALRVDEPIAEFQKQNPDIQVSLFTDADMVCGELLLSEELDIAFLLGQVNEPALYVKSIYQEPLYAWIHRDHPLAKKKSITLSDLIDEPIIMVTDQYHYYDIFVEWCHARGLKPDIRYRINDIMTIYYLASKNEGIALHPRYWQTMLVPNENLVDVPLVDIDFSAWQINLCCPKTQIPSVNQTLFTEFMIKYYAEHPFY